MSPFRGPGEEKTAETFAKELPDSWDVIAGKSLPGSGDDLDFVVIGERWIFLLEEKSWGPSVKVGDARCLTSHASYPSPIDRVFYLARVLAGALRDRLPNYKAEVGRRHAVIPGVVFSHDRLDLRFEDDFNQRKSVLSLHQGLASNALLEMDSGVSSIRFSQTLRAEILRFLTGLPGRNALPSHISSYSVELELTRLGYARCFFASSLEGNKYILRCVPVHGYGVGADIREVAFRESRALHQLDRLQRTPRCLPAFFDEEHQWIVTPIESRANVRSLKRSVSSNDPNRVDGKLPEEIAIRVIEDAFQALSDIHAEDLLHRGLAPNRIFLGNALRIHFTDFFMAHLPSNETIGPWMGGFDEDVSVLFRAPECRNDPRLSTASSDVFSLAYSLTCWLLGSFDLTADDLGIALASYGVIGQVLTSCLSPNFDERPTALEAAEGLRLAVKNVEKAPSAGPESQVVISEQTPLSKGVFVWEDGAELADRYVLRKQLGYGSFATTWLAIDLNVQQEKVIKVFHDRASAQSALNEFEAMCRITHERCSRTWDRGTVDDTTEYLVNEYVEGESLDTYVAQMNPDAQALRTVTLDVLSALEYLHSKKLLHRDISPRNIIIGPSGRAKLIDFGLCGPIGGTTLVGTPNYMAPELFVGMPPNEQSDIYALAASVLESMLGRLPYRTDQGQRVNVPPTDDERFQWGRLGHSILDLLFDAVALDRQNRISSAAELADRLRMAIDVDIAEGEDMINPTVDFLRQGYRGSKLGNVANRGLNTSFLLKTYIPTLLDLQLLPEVLDRNLEAVFLTGNPGDGKTAFLVKVHDALLERGAQVVSTDEAGWTLKLGGHSFVAVYDASESNEGLSSDELLHSALELQPGEERSSKTVLLAINDGRLIQFFTDFEHRYETFARAVRAHFRGAESPSEKISIVDLKIRSLSALKPGSGLAVKVLDSFTDPELWQICNSCTARQVCPITKNASDLREKARVGVAELVLVSHLRRERRATFRDLRSALGWLITGDLGCEHVHESRQLNVDLSKDSTNRLAGLAFSPNSTDYLVKEWTLLDPGKIAAPEVLRAAALLPGSNPSPDLHQNLQRELFLGCYSDPSINSQSVRAYRYFTEFTAILEDPNPYALSRFLKGITRIVGSVGFKGEGLAIAAGERGDGWAVLRTLPEDQFSLVAPHIDGRFVEWVPDRISLKHKDGARLDLSLDTAEIILRAADGELLDDVYSDVVRQEIEGFTAQLSTQPSESVLVIDELGSVVSASRNNQVIRLVKNDI